MPSEEELDLDSDLFFLKDFQLITVKNPKSDSPSILPPKSLPLLLNHTTPFFPPTPFLNTLMSLLCLITKLSTISAEDNWTSKDPLTPTWTDLLLKLSHPSLLPSDSTEPWMLISLNSKPILSLTLESISCFHHMPPSSLLKKLITNNFQLLKSPTVLSNPLPWWPNVTPDTENTWLAPCFTEEMLSPKMSMPLLPPSKLKEPSNSLTGAPLDSKSESITNLPPLSQEVT